MTVLYFRGFRGFSVSERIEIYFIITDTASARDHNARDRFTLKLNSPFILVCLIPISEAVVSQNSPSHNRPHVQ